MADKKREEERFSDTPQEHSLMCERHYLMPIDVTCEDCETFLCSTCVKEDHTDHNWQTIHTAATLRTRGLLKFLTKIDENDIQQIDEKIKLASRQLEENKNRCETEVSRIQTQCDAMIEKLIEIKKKHEKTLKAGLESTNSQVIKTKLHLENKKQSILQHVRSLRNNGGTMTDMILLKTLRKLTKLLSTEDVDTEGKFLFSMRLKSGDIRTHVLESMLGYIFNADQITVTETHSFHCGNDSILILEAMYEDKCLLGNLNLNHFELVNKHGRKEKIFRADVADVCVTDNNEIYVTNLLNNSISRLSLSGLVSTIFSTDPFEPMGICQTIDGDLLVTLSGAESDLYDLNFHSRRLLRHVTVNGNIIKDFEYHEDRQTRLFTLPARVEQNGNTDICVINRTSAIKGELVILSVSGFTKSVYRGHVQRLELNATDVACDSHFNIIVGEINSNNIHLLSPDGKFLRYLLTVNHVNQVFSLSLRNSTLWVGENTGLVKVFRYTT